MVTAVRPAGARRARLVVTDDLVESTARKAFPHVWDPTKLEAALSRLSIFTPEQAAESAEKARAEKRDLVRRVLEAAA